MELKDHAVQLSQLLKLLANENRLMILCLLLEQPKTVSALAAALTDITQPALSQHLGLLKAHGLLRSAKTGQTTTYRVADPRIARVIAVLKAEYCTDTCAADGTEPLTEVFP